MTLRSLVEKYLGWCPQFNLTNITPPPRFEFTSGGRLAFTLLIILLGIVETLGAVGMATFQDTTLLWYYWVNKLAGTFLLITYPLLIILALDVLLTNSLRKRHTIEFAAVILTYTASRIPRIIPDTQYLLTRASAGFFGTDIFIGLIARLTLVLLGVYVTVRLLKGKGIIVKQTFLVLTLYSALLAAGIIQGSAGFLWDYSSIWQPVAVTRLFLIWQLSSYVLAVVYFLSVYLKLSHGSVSSIVFSGYARAALFLHGSYNIVNIVYNDFYPKPGYLIFNLDLYNIALHLIVYGAFIVASFFSFRLPIQVRQGKVEESGTNILQAFSGLEK